MQVAAALQGVSFGYRPGQRVLEHVDLELGEGEFVAVAGPNGGGKTTLIRILLGLERPTEGTALLYGEPAHRFSGRRALGYLAQRSEVGGDAPATVREVVSAGRLAPGRLVGRLRREDRELVAEAIGRVGSRVGGRRAAPDSVRRDATARVHREGARRTAVSPRPRRADDRCRRRIAGVAGRSPRRPARRARRDDRVRLARVRRRRASRRAARARTTDDRLRRLAARPSRRLARPRARPCSRVSSCASRSRRARSWACWRRRWGSSSCNGASRSSATASGTLPSPASLPGSCSTSRRCSRRSWPQSLGGIAIELLRSRGGAAGDQALALVFYTGIALGVVLVAQAGALNVNLFQYLFGSILTVTRSDLALIAALGAVGLATIALLYRALAGDRHRRGGRTGRGRSDRLAQRRARSADRGHGRALDARRRDPPGRGADGAPRERSAAGSPGACARRSSLSIAIGLASALCGLTISYYADLPPGGDDRARRGGVYLLALVGERVRGT